MGTGIFHGMRVHQMNLLAPRIMSLDQFDILNDEHGYAFPTEPLWQVEVLTIKTNMTLMSMVAPEESVQTTIDRTLALLSRE